MLDSAVTRRNWEGSLTYKDVFSCKSGTSISLRLSSLRTKLFSISLAIDKDVKYYQNMGSASPCWIIVLIVVLRLQCVFESPRDLVKKQILIQWVQSEA